MKHRVFFEKMKKKSIFFSFTHDFLQIYFFDVFLVNLRLSSEFFDNTTSRTSQNRSEAFSWN